MLLSKLINEGLVSFEDSFETWQDAIVGSCDKLVEKGIVKKEYSDEIIECLNKYGPYIVIIDGVAMPHSTMGGNNVLDTAISFMKVDKEVVFEHEGEVKKATLFFTLAAKSSDEHLQNMVSLTELLSDEEVIEQLKAVKNMDELKTLAKKLEN